jgi:DNA-binding transcriptional MerR regulator/methylmalonyl-CoA mutase cobalamin-binding subunit
MKPLRYPIRAVSKLTGISVDTLRAWERRYAVVEPERDERGRLYSEVDVERLKLLRQLVEQGHAIGRVASLTSEELRALLTRGPDPVPYDGPTPAAPIDLGTLLGAVERFDAALLRRELTRLAAILPSRTLAREVALPLLQHVGEGWHEGRYTVAQEHLVTAELRSLIGALARLHAVPDSSPRLMLATPPGEQHELGTLVAALVASGSGFMTFYLGPGLPPAEVVKAARRVAPRAVVLGFTGVEGAPEGLAALAEVARTLPAAVECWVGGAGVAAAAQVLPADRVLLLEDLDAFERHLGRLRGRDTGVSPVSRVEAAAAH